MQNLQTGTFANKTASANIKASQGNLLGFFVNSTSAGTVAFYDDPSTGTATPITGTITPAAGNWYPLPAAFATGLNLVVGGTINVTIIYV